MGKLAEQPRHMRTQYFAHIDAVETLLYNRSWRGENLGWWAGTSTVLPDMRALTPPPMVPGTVTGGLGVAGVQQRAESVAKSQRRSLFDAPI